MSSIATESAAQRLAGEQVSRPRALVTAAAAAVVAGVLTYKVLRSGAAG